MPCRRVRCAQCARAMAAGRGYGMGRRWVRNRPQGRISRGGGGALACRGDRCFRGEASVFLINPGIVPGGDSRRICRPRIVLPAGRGRRVPVSPSAAEWRAIRCARKNVTVARLKWSPERLSPWRRADPRPASGPGLARSPPRPARPARRSPRRPSGDSSATLRQHRVSHRSPVSAIFRSHQRPLRSRTDPLVVPLSLLVRPPAPANSRDDRDDGPGRRPGTTSCDPPESPPGTPRCRTYCEWCRRAGRPSRPRRRRTRPRPVPRAVCAQVTYRRVGRSRATRLTRGRAAPPGR